MDIPKETTLIDVKNILLLSHEKYQQEFIKRQTESPIGLCFRLKPIDFSVLNPQIVLDKL